MSLTHVVDIAFATALPKCELHAHLTGSISPACLHEIWLKKRQQGLINGLEDPLVACRPKDAHHNVLTFFPVFDTYIYSLMSDTESVAYATSRVLQDFEKDGVVYLELRTTPREAIASGLTKEIYVETVLQAIEQHGRDRMSTYLILSIDRRNTLEQAMEVVRLALKYRNRGVVGIDLCGNPLKGNVGIFKEAFALAKDHQLGITLHFAEVPQSSTREELQILLSYDPHRIGHVINVSPDIEHEIESRSLGLELCMSCNVHAKLIEGGFEDHHFGKWYQRKCPIALCTDDVGIFGSTVSNEYLLAAEHFKLSQTDLVRLCRRAVSMVFGGESERIRLLLLLEEFEERSSKV